MVVGQRGVLGMWWWWGQGDGEDNVVVVMGTL